VKKFITGCCFIFILILIMGVVCLAAAPSSDYELLINDTFDGDSLNTDIWAYRTGTASGGKNRIENVRVQDGKLYFDYILDGDTFTCAGVISYDTLGYGYYETKAKSFQGVNGFHTSFWTSGGAGNARSPYHPQSNGSLEIDGFEMDSNETDTAPVPYYNLHYWWTDHKGIGGARFSVETDGDQSTADWFTMGFEWLPGLIIYYANGEEIGRNTTEVYGMTHAKLTSLAMPDKLTDFNGNIDIDTSAADENGYFGSSEYEYFTYHQKRLKNVNLLSNGHFELNRQNGAMPKCLYYEGEANVKFTPLAYDGCCTAILDGKAKLGQYIAYLLDGSYTLDGYFKTESNADARLVVYDKEGNELKSVKIPACSDWTYVSMPDIKIEDSAFALVETTSGRVWVDNLAFYCQEGDDSYSDYKDSDYENYSVLPNNKSYITVNREDATKSSHNWKTSSVMQVDNYYVYTSSSPLSESYYKNVYIDYEIKAKESGYHDLEILRVLYSNNPPSQTYTITVNGESVCDPVSVPTYSEEGSSDVFKLCTLNLEKGDVINVHTTCDPFLSTGSKCFRVLPMQLSPHSARLMETALVMQVSNPVFQYCNTPYAFDKSNQSVYPTILNGEIHIPYQPIKDILKLTGISEDTEYVSLSEIKQNSNLAVTENGAVIIIHSPEFIPNDSIFSSAYKKLDTYTIYPPVISKEATFVGTADKAGQLVYTTDDSILTGNWSKSSLGYNSSSLYSSSDSAEAVWLITPPEKDTYSVQIYSVSHDGSGSATPSTTSAGVDLKIGGSVYTCTLDQCNGSKGWYDLGEFALAESDIIAVDLYNIAKNGHLRACAVRLVPVEKEPVFVGNHDIEGQEISGYDSATKTGTWKASSGELKGCYYGTSGSSIKWNPVPSAAQKYNIQIFVPCYNMSSTTNNSPLTVTVDGVTDNYVINERKDTETFMGWYDLGTYDLTSESSVEILLTLKNGSYLRAKAVRLVPISNSPSAVKNGSSVIINSGAFNGNTLIYRECNASGRMIKIVISENTPVFSNITMENVQNSCKLFLWNNILSMKPLTETIELN